MESMMFKNRESRARILIIKYSGLVLLLTTLLSAGVVNAQTGIINGSVVDANNSEPLYGVQITVPQIGVQTETDTEGRFILHSLPEGSHTIVIRNSGFTTKEISVSVEPDILNVQYLKLIPAFKEDDRIFSVALQRDINLALTRQKESDQINSVISSEQLIRFADYSIEDAVLRVPGVQRNERGEINIRGVGLNRYYVTVDGQRLGSTGLGDRSFDLGIIPTDMIRHMEVIKVLTPDMHADGLAGVVNLTTYQPAIGQFYMDVRAGGGGTPRYFYYNGVANNFALNTHYSPIDEFSVAWNMSYQVNHYPSEMLNINYGIADFGGGPVDVIEQVSPGINLNEDSKMASRIQLVYQPSEQTRYHLRGLFNMNNRDIQQHSNFWSAGGDWVNQDSTGLEGSQGSYGYEATFREVRNNQYAIQVGAVHQFDMFNMEYTLGWAQTDVNHQNYGFPFATQNLNHHINWEDRRRPIMQPSNIRLQPDGSIDRRLVRLQTMRHTINLHVNNLYSANLDFDVPLHMVTLKFGGDALLSHKYGGFSDTNMDNVRPLTQYRFFMIPGGRFEPLNDYNIPWLVDMEKALRFLDTNEPIMRSDENLHFWNSEIRNHDIYENLLSSYVMATLEFGFLTLLGGARVEYSDNTYEGHNVLFNRFGSYEETTDTSQTNSNTHIFPNAQVNFGIGNRTNIRAAWSRSIWRPDYNMIAPFNRISFQDSTLFRGNPVLEPVISENLDLLFEHYFSQIGHLGLSLFYKELSNLFSEIQLPVSGGTYDGWQERTFTNGNETVTLIGAEVSWQQTLSFLPGFLKNLGIYANYTYTASDFEVEYRNDVSYPGHSPHVANGALSYNQGRFSGQITYHWRGALLEELQKTTELAPSINAGQQVYLDQYRDSFDYLTASLGFRISENFRFWADATNITGWRERTDYYNSRNYYPFSLRRSGFSFKTGIRYTF